MDTEFVMASPEQKGIASEKIIDFYNRLASKNLPLHSAILYIDGAIVSKTYYFPIKEGQLHRMFSIAKTVTALAIGLLSDQKRLSLSDRIIDYFPEKLPKNVHPYLACMTIKDMLMMRTCYSRSTYNKFDPFSDWVGSYFTATPDKIPGTVFHYDTSAAHVLAALCEKLSGQTVMDFVKKSMPELGLSEESHMLNDGHGVSMGGTGLMATSEDLLRIGILLYQQGEYAGKQLISREFIKSAISDLSPTLLNAPIPCEACGYGYMIWQTERNGFVCYGMGGQLIIVHPDKKIILVTTADTQGIAGGNQIIYDAFYETIYEKLSPNPVMECPYSLDKLRSLENNNHLKPVSMCLTEKMAVTASLLRRQQPAIDKLYNFPDNKYGFKTIRISTTKSEGILKFYCEGTLFQLPFGFDEVVEGFFEFCHTPFYGSAVWLNEDTLFLRYQLSGEAVGSIHIELFFENDALIITMRKVEETLFQEFQGTYVCNK